MCTHEEREQIDALLVQGEPYAKIAVRFILSKDAVRRHNDNHMAAKLVALRKAKADTDDTSALTRLEDLYERTNSLLAQAEHSGSTPQALQAVREARTTLESIAKITGELNEKPTLTINLAASPEWARLQALILGALAGFPDARLAVAEAIDIVGEIER